MAQFRALMLWTDAWIADTKHLSRCERGTYHDLLVLMWRTPGCSVPDDDAWLAKHLGMTADEVKDELRPIISEFCQSHDGRICQKRLMQEFEWSAKRSRKASENAKSRWNKEKDLCERNAGQQCSTVTVTDIDSANAVSAANAASPKRGRRRKPRTELPDDWRPPLGLDPSEVVRFRNHAKASGRLCADWNAAYRNWLDSPFRRPAGTGMRVEGIW